MKCGRTRYRGHHRIAASADLRQAKSGGGQVLIIFIGAVL